MPKTGTMRLLDQPFDRKASVNASSWSQGIYLWEIWKDSKKESFGKWIKK